MSRKWRMNQRTKIMCSMFTSLLLLIIICVFGSLSGQAASATDFSRKDLGPSLSFLFGTDWLGRDMFFRTLKGLSSSILIGMLAAVCSAILAVLFGMASAVLGNTVDKVVSFCIDLLMGIPHMLLLIMISVALGRGMKGVTIGIALTHWPALARVIRAEVMQLRESPYIQVAEKLGKGKLYIAGKHMLPHMLPQFLVGLILLFPHAILHEASITFLGFGLSTGEAAIGIILSEAMKYLITGKWWLAVFPGLLLLFMTALIYRVGHGVRRLTDSYSAQE